MTCEGGRAQGAWCGGCKIALSYLGDIWIANEDGTASHHLTVPVSGMVGLVNGNPTTANTNNRANGANPDDYDVTTLTGTDTARVVQLQARFRW